MQPPNFQKCGRELRGILAAALTVFFLDTIANSPLYFSAGGTLERSLMVKRRRPAQVDDDHDEIEDASNSGGTGRPAMSLLLGGPPNPARPAPARALAATIFGGSALALA
jgi:hypothetical protein